MNISRNSSKFSDSTKERVTKLATEILEAASKLEKDSGYLKLSDNVPVSVYISDVPDARWEKAGARYRPKSQGKPLIVLYKVALNNDKLKGVLEHELTHMLQDLEFYPEGLKKDYEYTGNHKADWILDITSKPEVESYSLNAPKQHLEQLIKGLTEAKKDVIASKNYSPLFKSLQQGLSMEEVSENKLKQSIIKRIEYALSRYTKAAIAYTQC